MNNGRTQYYEKDIGKRYGKINCTVFLSSGQILTDVYNEFYIALSVPLALNQ